MIAETTGFLHRALVWATTTTLCAADIRGIHDESEYITSNKTCFSNVGSNINWITVGIKPILYKCSEKIF